MRGTGSKDGTPSRRFPLRLPGRKRLPRLAICDENAGRSELERPQAHPPRAMATLTSATPMTTMITPVVSGQSPAWRAKRNPQTNNNMTASALEVRSAILASSRTINGITTGNVDRTTRIKMPRAPSQSRPVRVGRNWKHAFGRFVRVSIPIGLARRSIREVVAVRLRLFDVHLRDELSHAPAALSRRCGHVHRGEP